MNTKGGTPMDWGEVFTMTLAVIFLGMIMFCVGMLIGMLIALAFPWTVIALGGFLLVFGLMALIHYHIA
jgi:hypothetical protein